MLKKFLCDLFTLFLISILASVISISLFYGICMGELFERVAEINFKIESVYAELQEIHNNTDELKYKFNLFSESNGEIITSL